MLLAALIAGVLTREAPTISLESPGITVRAFCSELSRDTGRTYRAKDDIQSDLLAIRVSNVPVDVLVKRLVAVERATLQVEGNSYTFAPDEAVRAQLRAEALEIRKRKIEATKAYGRQFLLARSLDDDQAKTIAKKLSELQAKDDELSATNSDAASNIWAEKEYNSLRLPTGQAMLAMFEAIPTDELAKLTPDNDGVWSTDPTTVEHMSRVDPKVLITELRHDQTEWQEVGVPRLSTQAARYFNPNPAGVGQIARTALLRLSCSGSRSTNFVLDLSGFDASGNLLFDDVKSVFWDQEMQTDRADTGTPKLADPTIPPIEVSPVTQNLIRLWSSYPSEAEIKPWASDPKFLDRYFHPEEYDPAAETFGRTLIEIARARNRQLLAVETGQDAWSLPENSALNHRLNLSAIESELKGSQAVGSLNIKYAMDAEWITACPADLEFAASEDFSRGSLGTFQRAAREHHSISLMDVAHYAADQPKYFGSHSNRSVAALESLIPGLTGTNLLNAGNWPIKCLLGRMDAAQIAVAQLPSGLSLSNLTGPQNEALAYAFRFTRFSSRGRTDVWRSYPTDALPQGLPGGGVLHISTQGTASLLVRIRHNNGGWVEVRYVSPDEFAARMTELNKGGAENYTVLGMSPASRTQYTFRFDFPDDITASESLNDDAATGPEVKDADELPEPLRTEVKAAMRKVGL